jgi:protoheme ferro-lyase
VSDRIETLDDFGRALYGNHGHRGDELRLIPCPNSGSAAIVLLPDIVMRELAGWR